MKPLLSVLLVFLSAWTLRAAAPPPPWRARETPRYVLYSQASDKQTATRAAELDLLIAAAIELLEPDEAQLPPLTVLLFETDANFESYAGIHGAGGRFVTATFHRFPTWAVAAFSPSADTPEITRRFRYELARWVADARPVQLPDAVVHGAAALLAHGRRRDDRFEWGAPVSSYRSSLKDAPPGELARLLALHDDPSPYLATDLDTAAHAVAWNLAQRLLVTPDAGPKREKFLAAWNAGRGATAAFREAFGAEPDAAQSAWRNGPALQSSLRSTLSPTSRNEGWREPTLLEMDIALGRQAVATKSHEVAQIHVSRAHHNFPKDPAPYELQAVRQYTMNDKSAPVTALEALKLGSRDPLTALIVASAMRDQHLKNGTFDGPAARRSADLVERALERQPNFREANLALAMLLPFLDSLTEEDRRLVERSARIFPGDGDIVLGRATLALHREDYAGARRIVAELQQREHYLTRDGRRVAETIADLADYRILEAAVRAKCTEKDIAGARALVGTFLESPREPRFKLEAQQLDKTLRRVEATLAAEAAEGSNSAAPPRRLPTP